MRRWWIVGAAAVLAALAGPADAACGRTDAACLDAALGRAEAVLAGRTAAARAAVDTWEGNLADEDRPAWKARLDDESSAWRDFADRRCARERGEAAVLACRLRLAEVRSADLAARYGLDDAAPARADVETAGPGRSTADENEEEEAGSEYGPCRDAPTLECDLCGVTRCFETLVARARARLAEAEAAAAIGRRAAGVSAEQAAWRRFVDLACENAAWESPNRWAHSIGVLTIDPCILAETEARTRRLQALAGRP